jgi:hypothetical protein
VVDEGQLPAITSVPAVAPLVVREAQAVIEN